MFSLRTIAVDETYFQLKKCLLPEGRGRPPALPESLQLTKRLLLQLKLLRIDGKRSQKDVASWFEKMFPDVRFPSSRLCGVIERIEINTEDIVKKGGDMNTFLEENVDLDFLSDSLDKIGLNRGQLLQDTTNYCLTGEHSITNQVIADIEHFRSREKLTEKFVFQWIRKLVCCSEPDYILRRSMKQMMSTNNSLMKKKKQEPEKLVLFQSQPFKACIIQHPAGTSTVSTCQVEFRLKKEVAVLAEQVCMSRGENSLLRETIVDLSNEKTQLQQKLDESCCLNREVSKLERKTEEQRILIQHLQPCKFRRVKQQLTALKIRVRSDKVLHKKYAAAQERVNAVIQKTHADRRILVKAHDTTRKKLVKSHSRVRKLQRHNEDLQRQLLHTQDSLYDAENRAVQSVAFREQHNRFSDAMRQTLIQLQADGSVPAGKCRAVIQTVAKHLFNTDLDLKDLPCLQTAINVADEGHVLTKFQVAEKMLVAENCTLHMDGTSRNGKKIVGHQISLDSGETLSLGFTTVATEDSATLLDITVQLLQEIKDIYGAGKSEEEKDQIFQSLLSKLTSVMSDRAAVMKSFDKKLENFLQSELGIDAKLHFLHCNAHFLLGLSRACETALGTIEDDLIQQSSEKLGRDKQAKFQRFKKTENATSRLIRTTSDITGPRGDDKNGCRAEWIAYCEEVGKKSFMTSYRSNRFNSFFMGAAAIIQHHGDLQAFLNRGYLGHSNLKIESVAADCTDDRLLALVCAVAVLYLQVTGPFWQLLDSNVKHADFHVYIQKMEKYFEDWIEDPSVLLDETFSDIFGEEFKIHSPMRAQVFNYAAQHSDALKHALSKMMREILVTTRGQLKEFLEEGKYGSALSPEDKQSLAHCPLTNMLGENVFGELDFDMNKRRNASYHHRSTTQMLHYNKTAKWLAHKPKEEATQLLSIARRESKLLCMQHRRQEQIVRLKIREKLLENERKKRLKDADTARKKTVLIRKVLAHGGPCTRKVDVAHLRTRLEKNRAKMSVIKEALKNEIRFQKIVLNKKGTLKLSGTVQDLTKALEDHLPEQEDAPPLPPNLHGPDILNDQPPGIPDDTLPLPPDDLQPSKPKQIRHSEEEEEDAPDGTFSFVTQGQWVATFYDQAFYIGQVIEVFSPQSAMVQYLEQSKSRKDYFKWPKVDDVAVTDAFYIFQWDFSVLPVSSECCVWHVENIEHISESYKRITE